MRLIDADKLIELANNHNNKMVDSNDIARFPTTYNVDKVVDILEKDAQMLYSMRGFTPVKAWENKYLIPIVKAGGDKALTDILQEGGGQGE